VTRAALAPSSLLLLLLAAAACGGDSATPADAALGTSADAAPDAAPGTPDAAEPSADAALPPHGLRATYFRHHGAAVASRVDATVDFSWGDGAPTPDVGADHFSARWSGTLEVPAAGDYTFVVTSDDGVRLRVGGVSVVDDWRFHFATRVEGTVTLAAGPTPIVLEYFEKDLTAEIHLGWKSAALDEPVIPTTRLVAAASDDAAAPKPPYDNPVVPFDCPDPGILADAPASAGGAVTYYMVCTGGHFYIRRSADLVLWEDTGQAVLPAGKPPWAANGGRNWAPEIHRVGTGYVAYFTAADADNRLAIGAAWAMDPLGPYVDVGAPLVQDPLGVIDATFFADDDGSNYLIYKIDGNSAGQPTPIFARQLAADGRSFAPGSTRHQLLVNQPSTWEGGVIEAPWLVKHAGSYYLFYSGNVYDARYRTGVARASAVLGPYEKHGDPILVNNDRWVGPGHGSVVAVGSADYFFYHAWKAAPGGGQDNAAGRQGLLDRIVWDNGWPRLADGSPGRGLEPWPGAP
jgi:GH43 family beta-xylosidase